MPRPNAQLRVGCTVSVMQRSLFPRKAVRDALLPAGAKSLGKKQRIQASVTDIRTMMVGGKPQQRVMLSHERFPENTIWAAPGKSSQNAGVLY